ncbi:biopolymer transporter ExbD [Litoribacillus peritrichatus]|uniref:Biopolymer transporter ExbD n=1 Tax=Litoribacillus peritrichatus TaxID=718191 RepID=A0ABP7N5Y4_9GAMM
MLKKRIRHNADEAELNITAFMNLMIILVPVLLLSMVFANITVLELKLPNQMSEDQVDLEKLQLEVVIRSDRLVLADTIKGPIQEFPKIDEKYDFEGLSKLLISIKKKVPEKRDISLLAEETTEYQTLVSVMDSVRSYKTVLVASVVDAELFPDISIGDAPEESDDTAKTGGDA